MAGAKATWQRGQWGKQPILDADIADLVAWLDCRSYVGASVLIEEQESLLDWQSKRNDEMRAERIRRA